MFWLEPQLKEKSFFFISLYKDLQDKGVNFKKLYFLVHLNNPIEVGSPRYFYYYYDVIKHIPSPVLSLCTWCF